MDGLRALLSLIGLLLVVAGASFLLYVGYTVIKIIDAPEDIKILSTLFELSLIHISEPTRPY